MVSLISSSLYLHCGFTYHLVRVEYGVAPLRLTDFEYVRIEKG